MNMSLKVAVHELFADGKWYIIARFLSILDAMDYYECRKKRLPNDKLIIIDEKTHQEISVIA